jgi:hypothetical protein
VAPPPPKKTLTTFADACCTWLLCPHAIRTWHNCELLGRPCSWVSGVEGPKRGAAWAIVLLRTGLSGCDAAAICESCVEAGREHCKHTVHPAWGQGGKQCQVRSCCGAIDVCTIIHGSSMDEMSTPMSLDWVCNSTQTRAQAKSVPSPCVDSPPSPPRVTPRSDPTA